MDSVLTAAPRWWPAPAKLNRFLHITGRRDDGYHLLQTVFQLLDYGDRLAFSLRDDGAIHRVTALAGVPAEQDLVVRAARLLQEAGGVEIGTDIRVDKRLPMGGGLGGGSSNAATTLVALDHLWNTRLGVDTLAELGMQLGADVPVFVRGHSAWAEGVGEQLQPLDLPNRWYLVLIPPVTVSTAAVFSDSHLRRDCPPITIRDFLAAPESPQWGNVCEAPVRARYPEVAAALDALNALAPARLTGTGACVFAAFETESAANAAWQQLAEDWQGFVARGVNESPLNTVLSTEF
ncbi:4-(cytidine 5'-diphospho)-2-C-methyl-D-erythritol kinase [Thiohalophilus thiocyanatoxydans]|uniref:4-diphosphocytidyl-2-C-methyl-D-erythritol kinase n=1 Tax=Thiohalophilus thiocyanatoxydans TaxID=381308 RepID=A0A4R8IDW3_9GAMM|nr:4-(cytidine 5'-diphospho)-2-C-methyl-D-erythritol kinase [Thiohalophilus thiocyanatoxydans]TDX97759.1 4-diphosphocytidyl-2-C-methyl-D-erythritol kinase [Thiohalophilus thiocyanatoxydans]